MYVFSCFSHVLLFAVPWIVACQAPLSISTGFSWQNDEAPAQGLNLCLLCLLHWQTYSLLLSHLGSPMTKKDCSLPII